ncbi:MAG TPA: hypothetical protein VLE91_02775, partial [Candidatus Saccharimonadales bacterium]|nr:hypothetical protein [Candidatus Saccharimonadales bacterium]
MPKFHRTVDKTEVHVYHHAQEPRALSKEELDAKHAAALDAKTIISWKSPDRVFVARSKKYFTKVALYGFVFILFAVAFGEFVFVGVIIAVMFMMYVLSTTAPNTIEHRVNNMGIVSGERAFLWEELDSFWFDRKGDDRLLMVQTRMRFPTRLIMILTTVSERTLLDILEKHLHYHPAPVHTLLDKWATKVQSKISLD